MIWLVGHNLPGYMPDDLPEVFEDWEDGQAYLVDIVDEIWDTLGDELVLEAHTILHNAMVGMPIQFEIDGMVWWLDYCME